MNHVSEVQAGQEWYFSSDEQSETAVGCTCFREHDPTQVVPENARLLSSILLCSTKILVHYDPWKDLVLQCDASPYEISDVLAHTIEDGILKHLCTVTHL